MDSHDTQTYRTLFFDFLPNDLGQISGFSTRFQLYTVPGQVYYNATRRLVLQGADGVVFVGDSQARQLDENLESLQKDRKSTRLNSSHGYISYAVFCLKKKKKNSKNRSKK